MTQTYGRIEYSNIPDLQKILWKKNGTVGTRSVLSLSSTFLIKERQSSLPGYTLVRDRRHSFLDAEYLFFLPMARS